MKKLLTNFHVVEGERGGKVVDYLGREDYKFDRYGKMPELECFLLKREKKENYQFYFRVFGPSIYGNAFTMSMFSEGREYKEAIKIFTESDEAYGLFALEDNWDVWHEQAKKEFGKDCVALGLDVVGAPFVDDGTGSQSGNSVGGSLSGSTDTSSVWCDVVGYDNEVYRRRAPARKVVGQRYSSKGMTDEGRSRLRSLEIEVHDDRLERGEAFYLDLKKMMAPEVLLGGLLKQDTVEDDDFRMM
jgi:hypothetical protein